MLYMLFKTSSAGPIIMNFMKNIILLTVADIEGMNLLDS